MKYQLLLLSLFTTLCNSINPCNICSYELIICQAGCIVLGPFLWFPCRNACERNFDKCWDKYGCTTVCFEKDDILKLSSNMTL